MPSVRAALALFQSTLASIFKIASFSDVSALYSEIIGAGCTSLCGDEIVRQVCYPYRVLKEYFILIAQVEKFGQQSLITNDCSVSTFPGERRQKRLERVYR